MKLEKDGRIINYDFLIIATGAHTHPEETPGIKENGWHKDVFDFYTIEGAVALAKYLRTWQGGRMVLAGDITGGQLVSFLLYAVMVAAAITSLAALWSGYQEAQGAAERVFELLDQRPTVADPPQRALSGS